MDPIIPRYHLPEMWSGIGICPVCRQAGQLRVEHENVLPDRMLCAACDTAFEVESDGAHIRLAVVPGVLSAHAPELVDVWLLPAEVSDMAERLLGSVLVPATKPTAVAGPALGAEGVAFAVGQSAPAAEAFVVELSPVAGGGADFSANGSPMAGSNGAPAAVPVLGSTQPNPALQRAGPAQVSPAALALRSPTTEAPPAPAMTASDAAALALQAALADMLQGLPATAPRSDAVLADELAVALNVAPMSPPPAAGMAVPAERQHSPGNGATVATRALAGPGSTAAITAAVALPIISDSQAAPIEEPALPAAPAVVSDAAARAPASATRAADFAEQASRLHAYGNSLQLIQAALERSGASPDEARQAMANLLVVERARQARFGSTLQWVAGISILVMVILLAMAVAMNLAQRQSLPGATPASGTPSGALPSPVVAVGAATADQAVATPTLAFNPIIEFINSLIPGDVKIANGPTPTPGPTSAVLSAIFPPTATLEPGARATIAAAKSGLPGWVSTLVPNSLTVLNVPTPSLDKNGPPNAACPVTPANAASLFGGRAQYWSYDKSNVGWIMIVPSNPINVRLPANMTAGYLVIGGTLEMRSAQGPATIHNVNFVAISCRA